MIVRIVGEGLYEVDETIVEQLYELDIALDLALAAGEEGRFQKALATITGLIHTVGNLADNTALAAADLMVPQYGSTIAEVRDQMDSEAFEC
jgi:hypothetical protein